MSNPPEEIEKFVQRFYDLELEFSEKTIQIDVEDNRKLTDHFSDAISDYMLDRNNTGKALKLFQWINKMLSAGLVHPGQDLLRKLDECKRKNADLMKDLATVIASHTALQREHDRILRLLDQNQNPNHAPSEDNE